ncbi:MAG TPA: DUF4190 domain-containing protein [Kofleriaceae bacterium]|jgi:hypothetical protein|nr:DUF4190 domain-containing protein [Kofleriaceae bacterium]
MTGPYDPNHPPPPYEAPFPRTTSGLAIAGFVCSFLCGLLGLILSIVALSEIKKSDRLLGGEGLAIAGIVISLASMVLAIVLRLGAS